MNMFVAEIGVATASASTGAPCIPLKFPQEVDVKEVLSEELKWKGKEEGKRERGVSEGREDGRERRGKGREGKGKGERREEKQKGRR
jgi:hypothetical protein